MSTSTVLNAEVAKVGARIRKSTKRKLNEQNTSTPSALSANHGSAPRIHTTRDHAPKVRASYEFVTGDRVLPEPSTP
jgi:hypothetical protein